MHQKLFAAFVCGSIALGCVPLGAQSLADVARKEEERRKAIAQPAKVYTNKDLTAVPASSAPPPSTPAPADTKEAKPGDKAAGAKDVAAGGDKEQTAPKDKAYWSGRQKALQDQIDRNQTYADALQTRINALTADFVNRDDPAQRAVVERDRLKNIAELNRLKQTIQDDKKALADFAEEARRAGVPPGWLR